MDISYLKQRKKDLHLTYDELSNITGLSRKTIVNFFSNSTEPRKETVEAINKVLGIRTDVDDWSDEERASGVGRYPTYLSEDEWEWQEIRSEILRTHGEQYLKTLTSILKAIPKQ